MLDTDKIPTPAQADPLGDPEGDNVVLISGQGCHCYYCGQSHLIEKEEISMYDFLILAKAFYVQHRRCKPPKDDAPAPFARMKTRQEFNHAVNYHSDPQGLTELYKQISAYKKLADDVVQRHPLFDAQNEGFRNLYGQLNRRAEALGFKKYNSSGYYAPLYMIEDKRLTPDDVGRWLIFMALQNDRNSKLTKRVKLISWDETGALVAFLNAEKRIDFDQLVWYRDENKE